MSNTLNQLLHTLPQSGRIKAIYIRPEKYSPLLSVDNVEASTQHGLHGDHYRSTTRNKRQVTLIQYEHLEVISKLLSVDTLDAKVLRRNIVVQGINLLALGNQEFLIGNVRLRMTGICHPCSRMEKALGPGGYNAMRGHGGITATVVSNGTISVGDPVYLAQDELQLL